MMLKDWVKRLSGAGGVEFRLGQAYAVGQRDRQRLETELRTLASQHCQELASREAEMAVMAKRIEALELRLHHASRFGVAAIWHALDRLDELRPPTRLTCLACATTTEADRFGRREDECIFDGGKLVRHECPGCGCVFGPMKYLNLPPSLIDLDYTQLYAGYAEGDSTAGEIRTFHAMGPKHGGRYLNWGSGAWSGAIETLRAQGYDVWGYEPNASVDHPYVVRTREAVQGPFDGLFTHNVIEHLLDPAAQFSEFAELLAPDAVMAHATPCYAWAYPFSRFHVFFPMGNALQSLAARTGFVVTHAEDDGDFRVRVLKRAD